MISNSVILMTMTFSLSLFSPKVVLHFRCQNFNIKSQGRHCVGITFAESMERKRALSAERWGVRCVRVFLVGTHSQLNLPALIFLPSLEMFLLLVSVFYFCTNLSVWTGNWAQLLEYFHISVANGRAGRDLCHVPDLSLLLWTSAAPQHRPTSSSFPPLCPEEKNSCKLKTQPK